MGCVLIVFQSRNRPLVLTLLKSLIEITYCLIEVLLPAQEPMERKRYITSNRSYQRTFAVKITLIQNLNYGERLYKPKLYFIQRRLKRYINNV